MLGRDEPGAKGKEELKQSTYIVTGRKSRGSFVFSDLQSLFTCSRLNFALMEIAAKLLLSVENHLLIPGLNCACCTTTQFLRNLGNSVFCCSRDACFIMIFKNALKFFDKATSSM